MTILWYVWWASVLAALGALTADEVLPPAKLHQENLDC